MVNTKNKVYNPETKRFVLPTGKVGKKVIKNLANKRKALKATGKSVSVNSLTNNKNKNLKRALRVAQKHANPIKSAATRKFKTVNMNKVAVTKLANNLVQKNSTTKSSTSSSTSKVNANVIEALGCRDGLKGVNMQIFPTKNPFTDKGDAIILDGKYNGKPVKVKIGLGDGGDHEVGFYKVIAASKSKELKQTVIQMKRHIKCGSVNTRHLNRNIVNIAKKVNVERFNMVFDLLSGDIKNKIAKKANVNVVDNRQSILDAMTRLRNAVASIKSNNRTGLIDAKYWYNVILAMGGSDLLEMVGLKFNHQAQMIAMSTMDDSVDFYRYLKRGTINPHQNDVALPSPTAIEVKAVLFRLIRTLIVFERKKMIHGDLHIGNLLVGKYDPSEYDFFKNGFPIDPKYTLRFGHRTKKLTYELSMQLPDAKVFDFEFGLAPGLKVSADRLKWYKSIHQTAKFQKGWDLFVFATSLLQFRHGGSLNLTKHLDIISTLDEFFTAVYGGVPAMAYRHKLEIIYQADIHQAASQGKNTIAEIIKTVYDNIAKTSQEIKLEKVASESGVVHYFTHNGKFYLYRGPMVSSSADDISIIMNQKIIARCTPQMRPKTSIAKVIKPMSDIVTKMFTKDFGVNNLQTFALGPNRGNQLNPNRMRNEKQGVVNVGKHKGVRVAVLNAAMNKIQKQNEANNRVAENVVFAFVGIMKKDMELNKSLNAVKLNKAISDVSNQIMEYGDLKNKMTAAVVAFLWLNKVRMDKNARVVSNLLKVLEDNGFYRRYPKVRGMQAHTIKNAYMMKNLLGPMLYKWFPNQPAIRNRVAARFRAYRSNAKIRCKYQFVDFIRAVKDVSPLTNLKINREAIDYDFISGITQGKQFKAEMEKCLKKQLSKNSRTVSSTNTGPKAGPSGVKSKSPSPKPGKTTGANNNTAGNQQDLKLVESDLNIQNYSLSTKMGQEKYKASALKWEPDRKTGRGGSKKRVQDWTMNNFKFILEEFHNPHNHVDGFPVTLADKRKRLNEFMTGLDKFVDYSNKHRDYPWKELVTRMYGSMNGRGYNRVVDILAKLDAMARVDLTRLFTNFQTSPTYHTVSYVNKQRQHGVNNTQEAGNNAFNVVTIKYRKRSGGDMSIQVYGSGNMIIVGCKDIDESNDVVKYLVREINRTRSYQDSMLLLLDRHISQLYGVPLQMPTKMAVPKTQITNISASFRLNTMVKDPKELYKRIVDHFAGGRVRANDKVDFIDFKKQAGYVKFVLKMKKEPKVSIANRRGGITQKYPEVAVKITTGGAVEFSGKQYESITQVYTAVRSFLINVIKDVGIVVNANKVQSMLNKRKRAVAKNGNNDGGNGLKEYDIRYILKSAKRASCSKDRTPTPADNSMYARLGLFHHMLTKKGKPVYVQIAKEEIASVNAIRDYVRKYKPQIVVAYRANREKIKELSDSMVRRKLDYFFRLITDQTNKNALVSSSLSIPKEGECCDERFPRGPLPMHSKPGVYCCYKNPKDHKNARAKKTVAAVRAKGTKLKKVMSKTRSIARQNNYNSISGSNMSNNGTPVKSKGKGKAKVKSSNSS